MRKIVYEKFLKNCIKIIYKKAEIIFQDNFIIKANIKNVRNEKNFRKFFFSLFLLNNKQG